jgi:peroxiredoxin
MNFCRLIPFVFVVCAITGTALAGNDSGPSSIGSSPAIGTLKFSSVSEPVKADKTQVMKSLSLTGLDKVKHSLSDWNGKVILINFWATWCSPCLSEIRDFVTYQEQYTTHGLQIIGVGLDEEKKLRNVQRTLEINYPVLVADPVENVGLMERWGNKSGVLPYSVVIGRDGHVKYAHRGVMSREVFDEYVLPLLDKV